MKFPRLLPALVLCLLSGCVAPRVAVEPGPHANTAAAVARRSLEVSRELRAVESEQMDPNIRRELRRARESWSASLQAHRELDALLAKQHITFDAKYYALRQRQLDGMLLMIRQLRPAAPRLSELALSDDARCC